LAARIIAAMRAVWVWPAGCGENTTSIDFGAFPAA
jgi:hypothetical protein